MLDIQANSVALFYRKIREVIIYNLEQDPHEYFGGSIELDESYFGAHRKSKRGRDSVGKVAIFGILKSG